MQRMIKNKAYQVNYLRTALNNQKYVSVSEVYLSKEEAYRSARKAKASGKYQQVTVTKCILWV